MVYKMIVLLCSLSAPGGYELCDETNMILADHMARVSPSAERCEHDSQREASHLIHADIMAHIDHTPQWLWRRWFDNGKLHFVAGYDPADRKIKVLCIPS